MSQQSLKMVPLKKLSLSPVYTRRKLGLRGTLKNVFYRVAEVDGSVSKEPALQRGEEGGRGEGRERRGRRKRIGQKRERRNGEHGEEEGWGRSEEEGRGEEGRGGKYGHGEGHL